MRGFVFLVLAPLLIACTEGYNREQSSTGEDAGKCVYMGNDPSRIHCATTYIQLLADPQFYDGKRIMITAWGVSGEGIVMLYPSEDSMLTVESHASIIVNDGGGKEKLMRHLSSREYGSGRVVVSGFFHMSPSGSSEFSRFGSMSDAELMLR